MDRSQNSTAECQIFVGARLLKLEIIATSLEDAIEAARGGAHRLEIVRDLERDGLTPSIDLVRRIQREVTLPLRVIVRDSDGFQCRSNDERRALCEHAAAFAALNVEGLVVGWTHERRIDEETLGCVLNAAPSLRATFHRAFDMLPDPETAFRVLRQYPQVDRVLTSAGAGAWSSRCKAVRRYMRWAGSHIMILPGGGVNAEALAALAQCGAPEAHIGRAARVGHTVDGPVSAEAVRALVQRMS